MLKLCFGIFNIVTGFKWNVLALLYCGWNKTFKKVRRLHSYSISLSQIGGFRLPFISSGAALMAVGCLAWMLLPPQSGLYPARTPKS